MADATTTAVEEAKKDMPRLFTEAVVALLETLSEVFEECQDTKTALLQTKAVLGNDVLMEMGIRAWAKEIKPFEDMVMKKKGNLFKKIKSVSLISSLKLHKKWEDPRFKSRDKLWAHLQNLTQMANFYCGAGSDEQNAAFDALDRIRERMGIKEMDENGDAKINVPKMASYATSLIFNNDPKMRQDALAVSREFGALAGMGDGLEEHLSKQLNLVDKVSKSVPKSQREAAVRAAEKMLSAQFGEDGGGAAAAVAVATTTAPTPKPRKKK